MKQLPDNVENKIEAFLNRKSKQFPEIDTLARTIFKS